jgi:hypothetical protein
MFCLAAVRRSDIEFFYTALETIFFLEDTHGRTPAALS